jgi:hypothetical protein
MQIQVNVNNLTLIQSDELNENEYNIHKIQFTFSDEYSDGLAKVALFTGNSETYKVIITNDECNIPAEILAKKDCFVLGVYAFDVENDELIERFSPSPIKLYILDGSYIPDEETENSEPITPTDKEQILAELAKLEIDAEQIATNKQDIADIKQEQTEQNFAIQTNAEEIEQVRSEIPDKTSQLTNDSGFVNQTQMTNAIAEETTARQNADINLQEQIDAITVSSDVIDVLGTYQDLQNYDTSHVKANDVIKVLQDSTHDNAMSYYRWVITDHTGAWQYVGSEGPYYTKSEIDGKVQTINNDIAGLSDDIDTIEGTIEGIQEDIGNIETEQTEQNTRITELEQEVEDLQNNQLTGTAEGTSIDLTDSADSRVRSIELEGNSVQDGEPTPDNPIPINSAGDNGTITEKIENADGTESQTFTIPVQQPMRRMEKGTFQKQDLFFKNTIDNPLYDSNLTLNAWYERHIISHYDFTGEEDWKTATSVVTGTTRFYVDKSDVKNQNGAVGYVFSNRFIPITWAQMYSTDRTTINAISNYNQYNQTGNRLVIRIDSTIASTKAELNTFLSNNPTYAEYELETPTDLPCTEEQIQVLEAYVKARTYKPVTHMYSEDETPAYQEVVYVKDLETVINNLGGA